QRASGLVTGRSRASRVVRRVRARWVDLCRRHFSRASTDLGPGVAPSKQPTTFFRVGIARRRQHNGDGMLVNRSLLELVVRGVEVRAAEGPRGLGDAELLRRFADTHDEASFNILVARHGPLVWAVCRGLLPNESDAEDAFQATFLALVQSARRVRTPAVGAWLHGV